ncbi:hypothetical protein CXG81DRAFT_23210 [Caulochytrium protostelioides]|uniref:UNC-45/Cro1/She4 central domain-containing protein n=1 Tax=Caulochytrium protostelioides TaxID=1555241 RepID=A0A4P9XFD1_9FUNG|nr:hypothetical protein CXG81DRAFT_23210 [Caulochytrium protostelioides]|eukprot:RKP04258.1 hypothetical protein CXG81DRAFT_23210 [Caulochytrium protostelioides]
MAHAAADAADAADTAAAVEATGLPSKTQPPSKAAMATAAMASPAAADAVADVDDVTASLAAASLTAAAPEADAVEMLLAHARSHRDARQLDRAFEDVRAALARAPHHPAALQLLETILRDAADPTEPSRARFSTLILLASGVDNVDASVLADRPAAAAAATATTAAAAEPASAAITVAFSEDERLRRRIESAQRLASLVAQPGPCMQLRQEGGIPLLLNALRRDRARVGPDGQRQRHVALERALHAVFYQVALLPELAQELLQCIGTSGLDEFCNQLAAPTPATVSTTVAPATATARAAPTRITAEQQRELAGVAFSTLATAVSHPKTLATQPETAVTVVRYMAGYMAHADAAYRLLALTSVTTAIASSAAVLAFFGSPEINRLLGLARDQTARVALTLKRLLDLLDTDEERGAVSGVLYQYVAQARDGDTSTTAGQAGLATGLAVLTALCQAQPDVAKAVLMRDQLFVGLCEDIAENRAIARRRDAKTPGSRQLSELEAAYIDLYAHAAQFKDFHPPLLSHARAFLAERARAPLPVAEDADADTQGAARVQANAMAALIKLHLLEAEQQSREPAALDPLVAPNLAMIKQAARHVAAAAPTAAAGADDERLSAAVQCVESLAYLSSIPAHKPTIAEDRAALKSLVALGCRAAATHRALVYGIATVFANLTVYPYQLRSAEASEEHAQIRKLRAMANGQKVSKQADQPHPQSLAPQCARRCRAVQDAGVCAFLNAVAAAAPTTASASTAGSATAGSATHSLVACMAVAQTYVALVTEQEPRGALLQQGATKALLRLASLPPAAALAAPATTAAAAAAPDVVTPGAAQVQAQAKDVMDADTLAVRQAAAQALAKLAITVDPTIGFGPLMVSLVRPLVALTASPHPLAQFEALMALTNLASVDDRMRDHAVQAGLAGAVDTALFTDHPMIRRAATEAVCNLLYHPDVYHRHLQPSATNTNKFRLWLAMMRSTIAASSEDHEDDNDDNNDSETPAERAAAARAGAGALAILIGAPPAVALFHEAIPELPGATRDLLADPRASAEMLLRGLEIAKHLLPPRAGGADPDEAERAQAWDAAMQQRGMTLRHAWAADGALLQTLKARVLAANAPKDGAWGAVRQGCMTLLAMILT